MLIYLLIYPFVDPCVYQFSYLLTFLFNPQIKDISDFKRLDKNMVMEMDRVLTHDIPLLLQKVTKGKIFDNNSSHNNLLSNSYLPLYTHTIYVFINHSFPLSLSYTLPLSLNLSLHLSPSLTVYLSLSLSLSFSSFFSLPLYLSINLSTNLTHFLFLFVSIQATNSPVRRNQQEEQQQQQQQHAYPDSHYPQYQPQKQQQKQGAPSKGYFW